MPATKEARGFLYTLLIIGTLVIIASLNSTVWASPSQGVNGDNAAPPIAVPAGGAVKAFAPGFASTLTSPDMGVTVRIPSSAPAGSFFLVYEPQDVADAPAPAPAGLSFTETVFELSVVDLTGVEASDTSFSRSIAITVAYTSADVEAADGNPDRLVIYKYDEDFSEWTPLTTTFDPVAKTVTAHVTNLSFFALMGGEQPPTPTPTPTPVESGEAAPVPTATLMPPAPGDLAPSSGLLLGMLIAAFILIGAGSYYMRQSNQG